MGTAKRKVLNIGDTILDGKYEIIKVIHTSGMANVYLVEDVSLNKQWCLKEIIKSEAGKNMVEYRSLIREANIMKSLNHASIPRIVTMEEDGDSIFIVMDYVDGLSIKDWLVKKGRVDQTVTVSWMKQVCGVIGYLHSRKNPIFYRDMKPDNIMIQSDGNIKVLDFGISEVLTENNKVIKEALGTKGYAAPEQKKKGMPYDLRSDIFAMGRTMYYMLTGLNPSVVGEDLQDVRVVNQSISVGLGAIVNKCMAQDPNDRYQSVEELMYDLQNYDKLDFAYKKRLRFKVDTVVGLFIGSVFLMTMSIVPFMMNSSKSSNEYNYLVNVAYQTGKEEDFEAAIEKNPSVAEPYIGYIEALKQDGSFSKEEEKKLLNLINPVLADIKKESAYGELAYDIGKMYWFYYDDTLENRMTISNKWFEDAIEADYKVEESKVFYNLGQFKKTIAMSIAESDEKGKYKEYWDELMESKEYNTGEITEIQVNIAILDAISSYAYRLKVDGVSYDDISSEIDRIGSYIKESKPSEGKATEMFEELKKDYSDLTENTNLEEQYQGGDSTESIESGEE